MNKLAYPNFSDNTTMMPIANLNRWTESFKTILVKQNLGASREEALKEVVGDWSESEQFNFKNWIKYYESGDQLKYKKAQYYANDQISYFLPNPTVKNEPIPSPLKNLTEVQQEAAAIAQQNKPGLSEEDKRKVIEDQRRKLISRLNSVEKLLGSQQGHLFAGKEFENLLHAIYELKKQIQTINKVSLSSQIYVDLMIRQANSLRKKGCKKAAEFMVKFAQQTPGSVQGFPGEGEIPMAGSVEQGLGSLDNPPLSAANLAPPPNEEPDELEGIGGFLDNMEGGGVTDGDQLEADDEVLVDDDVLLDQEVGPEEELMVEAQLAPPAPSTDLLEPQQLPEKKQETPVVEDVKSPATKNIDAILDNAFSQITPEDLLNKLQEISTIFQKKEILRQLSIADLMINSLGLSPYFPEFSELQQKNIDSLNYTNTRLVNIIATLQGSIGKSNIDLNPEQTNIKSDNLQKQLEQQQRKEKARKAFRKEVEDQQLQDKVEKPALEVESPAEELAAEQPIVEAPTTPKLPNSNPI